MSGGEDTGAEEADGGRGRRRLTKCFLFFSFFVFPFSFSFAKSLLYAEETKAGKYVKPDGEGRRKEGNNPAWWPLSKQGSWTKRRETDLTQRERAYRPIYQTRRPLWGASQQDPGVTTGPELCIYTPAMS
jgi:hypothetical protein